MRKAIAKVLTVINEKRIETARDASKKKKYTPLDLRFKKTRAFRRRLTRFERTRKLTKTIKKEGNFRQRRFAVAA